MSERRVRRLDALAAKPCCGGLVHRIERGHFDAHIGCLRHRAIHKLQVADRRQKRCAATCLLVPAMSRSEAQRGEEARQAFVGRCAPCRTQKGDPFDHDLILSCGNGGPRWQPRSHPPQRTRPGAPIDHVETLGGGARLDRDHCGRHDAGSRRRCDQAAGIGARSARGKIGIDLLLVSQRGGVDVMHQVVTRGGDKEQRVVGAERSRDGRGNAGCCASAERDVSQVPEARGRSRDLRVVRQRRSRRASRYR